MGIVNDDLAAGDEQQTEDDRQVEGMLSMWSNVYTD